MVDNGAARLIHPTRKSKHTPYLYIFYPSWNIGKVACFCTYPEFFGYDFRTRVEKRSVFHQFQPPSPAGGRREGDEGIRRHADFTESEPLHPTLCQRLMVDNGAARLICPTHCKLVFRPTVQRA